MQRFDCERHVGLLRVFQHCGDGVIDTGEVSNEFSADWLFSYRPVPGTLVYLGYGSTLEEPREFRFQNLRRTRDGFFGKISYLVRF